MTTFSFCFFQKTLLKNCYHDIVSIYQRESCSAAKSQHLSILRLDFVHFLLVAKMSKITVTKVRWLGYVTRVPKKVWRSSPVGYTHGKAVQRSTKDQVMWFRLRTGWISSWCGASRTIRRCWELWYIL